MSSPQQAKTGRNIYTAERIEKARIVRGGTALEYLVKWEGYPSSQNTWEPRANILDKHLIATFKKEQALKRNKRYAGLAETGDEQAAEVTTTWSRESKLERKMRLSEYHAAIKDKNEKRLRMGQCKLEIMESAPANCLEQEVSDIQEEARIHSATIAKAQEENAPDRETLSEETAKKHKKQKLPSTVGTEPTNRLINPEAPEIAEELRISADSISKAHAQHMSTIVLKANGIIVFPQRKGVLNGPEVNIVIGIVDNEFLVRRNDYVLELMSRDRVKRSNPMAVINYYEGLLRLLKPDDFPKGC